jgi:hypothetical protein
MRLIDADILLEKLYDYEFTTLCPLDEVSTVIDYCPAVEIVHCQHCTIKKAVQHKDGIVWRCPHRTGDVKMEGYCESGVRADGS